MKTNETIVLQYHLPQIRRQHEPSVNAIEKPDDYIETAKNLDEVLEIAEKKYILQVLKQCENNKTKAAKVLEVSLRSLYYKLDKYGIG